MMLLILLITLLINLSPLCTVHVSVKLEPRTWNTPPFCSLHFCLPCLPITLHSFSYSVMTWERPWYIEMSLEQSLASEDGIWRQNNQKQKHLSGKILKCLTAEFTYAYFLVCLSPFHKLLHCCRQSRRMRNIFFLFLAQCVNKPLSVCAYIVGFW